MLWDKMLKLLLHFVRFDNIAKMISTAVLYIIVSL